MADQIGKVTAATASVSSAYGKELKEYGLKDENGELITSIKVPFEFSELDEKNEEHVAVARKEFDEKDIVKAVNAARKAAALASARTKALKDIGVEAPAKDSEDVIKANFRRQYRNMNLPDAVIENLVEQAYQAAMAAKQ